jgi:hypothetical protein
MPWGASPLSPDDEISPAFTVAPEVVYSPTVLATLFVTNKSDPETATPAGASNPKETREAFTVDPDVVYSPIVPSTEFRTKICAESSTRDSSCSVL